MSKNKLVRAVALRTAQPQQVVARTVDAFLECLTDELGGEGKVRLAGFGSFRARRREARRGYNIQTRQTILIPMRRTVQFRPGSRLRRAIR